MTKQGLQTFFSNKVLLVTSYILFTALLGAVYPTSEYASRWINALLVSGAAALSLAILRDSQDFWGPGGKRKRLAWYCFMMGIGLYLAFSSPSDEAWWLNISFPVALSIVPLLVYDWFLGRDEGLE